MPGCPIWELLWVPGWGIWVYLLSDSVRRLAGLQMLVFHSRLASLLIYLDLSVKFLF